MSRAKSSRPDTNHSSVASRDFTSYMIPDLHELPIDQDESTSKNSLYLKPEAPTSYTIIEVGANKEGGSDLKKRKKTGKSHRKRSFVEQ